MNTNLNTYLHCVTNLLSITRKLQWLDIEEKSENNQSYCDFIMLLFITSALF